MAQNDGLSSYERCLQHTDKQNDVELDQCVQADLTDLDAKLNARYVYLMRSQDKQFQAALRDAQRIWIGYRDSTCAIQAETFATPMGTADRFARDGCLRGLTEQRVDWLNQRGNN